MKNLTKTNQLDTLIPLKQITVGVIISILLFSAPSVQAIITSQIVNISPVTSDQDGSNPNSASGGRVNQLATHPTDDDIFFAASEYGGLYTTTDAGRNWSYVSGHVPQVMWDVKFSPINANIVVATSFFDGKTNPRSGINISTDAGVTWSVPATARPDLADCATAARQSEPAAFGIAFDPQNPSNIYVGTNCGLAISTNNGSTWDFVDPTPGTNGGLEVWDVIVHDGGIIDICGQDGHQRSTDGGGTFIAGAAEVGGICSLAVSPDEANVLFMVVGMNIFESRDGGASWPTTTVNPARQGRIPFVKVNNRTGNAFDLWFGDVSLFRVACTTPANTGSNARRCPPSNPGVDAAGNQTLGPGWANAQQGGHNDVGDIVFDTDNNVNACPILFSNDGGVYFNLRSGANCHDPRWEQPTTSVTALWLFDMDGNKRVNSNEEGIYMGQQDSGAFGTKDAPIGTPSWKSPGCCDVFDVEAEDNRVVYTMCCWPNPPPPAPPVRRARMFIDDDNMDGGTEINNYPAGNLVGFRDSDSLSNYAANRYAVVTSGGVFFTTNIAASPINWQPLGTGAPAGMCGVHSSTNWGAWGIPVFYARTGGACRMGGSGGLWRHSGASTAGAWTQVQRGGNNNFGVFGVNPSDPTQIIANDMSGATPTMVRSTNSGTSWTVLTNLDTILTGNNDFLLQTQTTPRNPGVGYPQASLVAINPENEDMVVVGAMDSGVFISINGGDNWKLLTDPRNNNAFRPHISRPLHAHFETIGDSSYYVYIGARGRGAWRIRVNLENWWAGAIWRNLIGVTCSGNSCPGWEKLDNNIRAANIVAGNTKLYQIHQNGHIWVSTGGTCPGLGGESCPGWRRLDNNKKSVAIAAGGDSLYQLHNDGSVWKSTGAACSGNSCRGWRRLDNNYRTIAIEAGGDNLYQLHNDGSVWKSTGAACSGNSCRGWRLLDSNPKTIDIKAAGNRLYQLHYDGSIWRHTGTACSGNSCPGWVRLDNNARSVDINANVGELFQRHRNGAIWRSTGGTCSGDSCPGWRRLDNYPGSTAITGAGYQDHHDSGIWKSNCVGASAGTSCPGWRRLDNNYRTKYSVAAEGWNARVYQLHGPKLYQLHNNGAIWQSTGRACSGNRCPGWQRLDNNPRTKAITASGGRLFQLHDNGKIWRATGRPCTDDYCPGWEMLDNNPRSVAIVSGGGQLYQRHSNGAIWRFTGRACSGNSCPGWVLIDNNRRTAEIVAAKGQLYQRHSNGAIWRFTGRACSGNSCPGWVLIDNNRRTEKIVASGGLLHQLHSTGHIWTHTGRACSGNSCPGWRLMDNNSRTKDIIGGGRELYQLHNDGKIWESTGTPCTGNSCPGWRLLDNNSETVHLTAAGGNLYQLHNNGAIWRSDGRSCTGASCPGWQRLDNNRRTVAIEAAHE